MDTSRWVSLHLEGTWKEGPLFTDKNIKIIVRGMQPCVTFCTQGRTEDNEVFGNACMDDIHSAYSSASVAENPLREVGVELNLCCGIRSCEVCYDMLDHSRCVIR